LLKVTVGGSTGERCELTGAPASVSPDGNSPPVAFWLSLVPNRAEVAVVAHGDLDLASVETLEREVRELRTAGFTEVVIDLSALSFLDSVGLCLLIRLNANRGDGRLDLVAARPDVQRIFDVTGTHNLFTWRVSRFRSEAARR
jgi:anti-sigma B factor antagonist